MSLVNVSGKAPISNTPEVFLRDEECFLKFFEGRANLCFDPHLSENLSRFARNFVDIGVDGFKPIEFSMLPKMKHVVGRIMLYIARFVCQSKQLKALAESLDKNINKDIWAYDIYTKYIEELSQQPPILLIIPNFYEEKTNIPVDDLSILGLIIDKCQNVRIWICDEKTKFNNTHSQFQRFYDIFDPVPLNLFDALKNGKPLPYVYFSYNWEPRSDETVDQLCVALKRNGLPHRRDKENCSYRSDIHEFMNYIREGNHVVVLLSKPYLKSFYCLYELTGIMAHPEYEKRIYPIIVDHTIREDEFLKDFEDFWKTKLKDRAYIDTLKDKTVKRFTLQRKRELIRDIIDKIPVIEDYISKICAQEIKYYDVKGVMPLLEDLSHDIKIRV